MKCNSIMSEYVDLNRNVLKYGEEVYKDNTRIKELLGVHRVIDDPLSLGYRELYRNYTSEQLLLDIVDGKFHVPGSHVQDEMLYEYVVSLDKPDVGDFVYTYPNRILEHFGVNQLLQMKKRLLDDLWTNRAIATIYDVKADASKKDIPCLQIIQCLVRDGELTIHIYFRSNDMFGAFYSNMFFLTYLGLKLQEELNKELIHDKVVFGGLYYYCSSCHIYSTDLKASDKLVRLNR